MIRMNTSLSGTDFSYFPLLGHHVTLLIRASRDTHILLPPQEEMKDAGDMYFGCGLVMKQDLLRDTNACYQFNVMSVTNTSVLGSNIYNEAMHVDRRNEGRAAVHKTNA
eukprot:sb/3477382/